MANAKEVFKRKLSAEEAGNKFIVIQRRELDFFPKVGKPFKLKVGKKEFETFVQAVECWCQGPQKPHSHYRLDLTPMRDVITMHWGTKVIIEKVKDNLYVLKS